MQTATVTNPLGLDVEWRHGIEPYHDAWDTERLATLTAAMEANGWQGPPIVCDADLAEANQDRAYTGSHRIQAWKAAQDDVQAEMPCVFVQDLCEALGIDWEALRAENDYEDQAVIAAIYLMPDDIAEAYGLDIH